MEKVVDPPATDIGASTSILISRQTGRLACACMVNGVAVVVNVANRVPVTVLAAQAEDAVTTTDNSALRPWVSETIVVLETDAFSGVVPTFFNAIGTSTDWPGPSAVRLRFGTV